MDVNGTSGCSAPINLVQINGYVFQLITTKSRHPSVTLLSPSGAGKRLLLLNLLSPALANARPGGSVSFLPELTAHRAEHKDSLEGTRSIFERVLFYLSRKFPDVSAGLRREGARPGVAGRSGGGR